MDEGGSGNDGLAGRPRKSWQMRKRQERAAIKEGLAEWQARTDTLDGAMEGDRTEHALADALAQEPPSGHASPRGMCLLLMLCWQCKLRLINPARMQAPRPIAIKGGLADGQASMRAFASALWHIR